MYKYYKKNDKNIMYYYFDSISEFIDYLDNTPLSNSFKNYRYLSSIKTNDIEWSGTNSLDEAKNLAKYGYDEDFDKFIELKLKLEKYIKLSTKKNKQFNDYIGYAPDVKAYLEGCPLSMLNKKNQIRKQIDIYFNTSYSAITNQQQIFNRGIIILSIVEVLEKLGFSVNLNIFDMSYEYDQVFYAVFRLKNTTERLNIKKIYFPMCHRSWLRRLVFRLQEETPDISKDWHEGYGYPAGEDIIREVIDLKPNDIVIPQPKALGIKGIDLIDDANATYKYINEMRNTDDFKLPHLEKVRKIK